LAGGDEMKKLLEKLETLVDEATLLVREERARRALAAAPTVQPFAPYVPSRTEEALWEFPPDVTCGGATTNKFPVPVPIAMTAWNANCGGAVSLGNTWFGETVTQLPIHGWNRGH
jgi:hypothetical protein